MTEIFVSDLFKEDVPNWESFYDDFHDWVHFGDLPDYFGRYAPYQGPLWHMHLAANDEIRSRWRLIKRPYNRTTPVGDDPEIRALDIWFMYAYDQVEDRYLLLTIMGPDAHDSKRWGSFVRKLKIEIIEPWIEGRIKYDPVP